MRGNVKMIDKVTFTKEEIDRNVKVPAIVEVELRHLLEERLKQSGLYYRLFSRIKTSESLERKFQIKDYNQEKKIQDLIGLRIDVYFEDDLRICKQMLERMFSLVEWAESEQKEVEFKPVKINGVFRLPEYLRARISEKTWDMCIDTTMEIQIKTVFFEGWHEIEHDMKYKGADLWGDRRSFSRYFNSILATLELCDKSLVTLFENLGHDLYKDGNWLGMMKAHYRLKMDERPLYPELEELLDHDHSENNLGKQLFKTPRQVLVEELLKQPRPVPINVNTITALVNQAVIHDPRLDAIFRERDVFDDGNDAMNEEISFSKMAPFRRVPVFKADVVLSDHKMDTEDAFRESARLVHHWMREKYGYIERGIPDIPCDFDFRPLGYTLQMKYRPEEYFWEILCSSVDMDAAGQVWITEASVRRDEDGLLHLSVYNGYAVAGRHNGYLNRYFSCPKFYSNISDKIGVLDVCLLSTSRRVIRKEQADRVRALVSDEDRSMPVCLITSPEKDNGWLDEDWLENFRVYDFTRMAGRYAHIYTCSIEVFNLVMEDFGIHTEGPAVCVIPRLKREDLTQTVGECGMIYTPEDVAGCSFGRHQVRHDVRRYDIVTGGQAFYHKLLHEMRTEMIDG